MNKRFFLIVLMLTCKVCNAQNLIPNGGFEQYSGCPNNYTQFDSLLFWFNPCIPPYGITGTGSGSPDYFTCGFGVPNNVFGYQYPHGGNGYCAVALYRESFTFREYIEVPLISTLTPGANYHFQMYMSIADISEYSVDTLGVYFSATAISNLHSHVELPYVPQIKNLNGFITDTMGWLLYSGNFTAAGGENYLIIGNFNSDAQTSVMMINSTGSYAYVYIDDVSLTLSTSIEKQTQDETITIYPNPVNDKLDIAINNDKLSKIILYDIASKKVLQKEFKNSVTINTEQLAKGIYLYEVRNKNGVIKKGKVVKPACR